MLYTRPSGAGSNTPATAATPAVAHAAASPAQNGPSSGSAAARRSVPNRTIVASGNTASSAPSAAASSQRGPRPREVEDRVGADRDLTQRDTHPPSLIRIALI